MKTRIILVVGFFVLFLFSGCAQVTPQATQTPTPQPTVTVTPTITASPAPTATATAAVDPYIIDMEKFLNPAPSYAYMVVHPEEYQQAPDLLSDVEAFKDWYYNQYVPALLLGHEREIPTMAGYSFFIRDANNVNMGGGPIIGMNTHYSIMEDKAMPLYGELPIAYFMHGGKLYPILAFTIYTGGISDGTFSVILHPDKNIVADGYDAIKYIYEGAAITNIRFEREIQYEVSDIEIEESLINDGFNWQVDGQIIGHGYFNIGMGSVGTMN